MNGRLSGSNGDRGSPGTSLKPEATRLGDAGGGAFGIDVFVDENGSTTVASAVAILVSLVLVFGLVHVEWTLTRAADVQSVADAGALAGMNMVSAYVTIAQILDAVVLSLGLVGMLTFAIGLVLSAIPVVNAVGPPVLSAAQQVFAGRERLARTTAQGLQQLERALPYLVAANALFTVRANAGPGVSYVGVALPYPLEGESDFGLLASDDGAARVEKIKEQGDEIDRLTEQAARYQEAAQEALERGWESDCGGYPSMRERAEVLIGLSGARNPHYPASSGWDFGVPILRARAYYQQRLAQEAPADASVAENTRSASRKAFYKYSLEQVERSSFIEYQDGTVSCDLRRLPANTSEVRETTLYTDSVWPCTLEEAGRTIHAYRDCPGARGLWTAPASVADEESGVCVMCSVCQFTVVDLGRTPAASTSIENGFEHHWRAVVDAAEEYEAQRFEQARHEGEAQEASKRATDLFGEALGKLGTVRVGLMPPGRHGCVCVVADPTTRMSPDELVRLVAPGTSLPPRVAVSAAVLARDAAASGNNILAGFFDGLIGKGGFIGGVSSVLDAVMSAWGGMLVSYGNGYQAFTEAMNTSFKGLSAMGMGRVSSWLKNALKSAVNLTGMQPADLSAKKPVLVNSADVMNAGGNDWYNAVRNFVLLIQRSDGEDGPTAVLAMLGIAVETLTGSDRLLVAEIEIPGTSLRIPIEIDFSWLAELEAA